MHKNYLVTFYSLLQVDEIQGTIHINKGNKEMVKYITSVVCILDNVYAMTCCSSTQFPQQFPLQCVVL